VERGVRLAAVLGQSAGRVRRYIEDSGLPFDILIDEARDVMKAYGVWHRIGLDAFNIARPALFAIDRTGTIRALYVADRQDEFPSPTEIDEAVDLIAESEKPEP
jgi:peroxiredoxin